MRNDWRVRAAVLLGSVLAVVSCSTTQPDQITTRTASVRMITSGFVNIFNCYEIWANDANGNPEFQGFVECYTAVNDQGNPRVEQRSLPWRYSVSVSIIRKGTTGEVIATSLTGVVGSSIEPGDSVDNFISMTDYDPGAQPADFKPSEIRPGYGLVSFLNGKQVSRGSPFWLLANGFDLGEPNILSASPSFDFEVNTGDTIIVRARKQKVADAPGFIQVSPPVNPPPKITLTGQLAIGGVAVNPTGTIASAFDDAAGISFSFTVQ